MRILLPRLRDFFFILVLAGALATGSRMLNTDSDLGRHLSLGAYILSSGHIPTHDILSFTKAGEPRPPYEWLAQVLLAAANHVLGLDGVVLLIAGLIALAFTLVYIDAAGRSRAPILSLLIVAWAAVAASLHWLARPHIFSFVLFAAWLYGLERTRRLQPWRIWYFPVLMLVWANTHGGFLYGFLALIAYAAGWFVDSLRRSANRAHGSRWLIITISSLVASILTPDLWHNWDAVLNNRSAYVLSQTAETMPLRLTLPAVWPFIALVALAAILLLLLRAHAPATHVFLLAGLLLLSIVMVRNIPFFAIAAAPILSSWAAEVAAGVKVWVRVEDRLSQIDATFRGFLWSGLAVLLVVVAFAYRDAAARTDVFSFRPDIFPVQAADWLIANPQPGHMFSDFNWGGYLLYRLWPGQQVFIDSQSDFYGEALTREAAQIAAGDPGWQAALDRHEVHWILVPRSAGLASAASSSPAWRVTYQDDIAVILIRR